MKKSSRYFIMHRNSLQKLIKSLQDVEYKPYYKCYAKVTKAYKPRTNEDVCLVFAFC